MTVFLGGAEALRLPQFRGPAALITGSVIENPFAPLRCFVSEPFAVGGQSVLRGRTLRIIAPRRRQGAELAVFGCVRILHASVDLLSRDKRGDSAGYYGYSGHMRWRGLMVRRSRGFSGR